MIAGSTFSSEMNDTSTVASSGGSENAAATSVARVRLLHHDDAPVGAQPGVELAVPHVHRVHAHRAALEQALGESPGRGTDVEAHPPARDDAKGVEDGRQLVSAAAHELLLGRHVDGRRIHERARLVRALAVDLHVPGHDQPRRLLPAGCEPTGDQRDVQSLLRLAPRRGASGGPAPACRASFPGRPLRSRLLSPGPGPFANASTGTRTRTSPIGLAGTTLAPDQGLPMRRASFTITSGEASSRADTHQVACLGSMFSPGRRRTAR